MSPVTAGLVPMTLAQFAAAQAAVLAQGDVPWQDQVDNWRQFYENQFPAGAAINPTWDQVVANAGGVTATWPTLLQAMDAALQANHVFPDGDPVGACVYNVDGNALCQVMTSLQCLALNGNFSQGQSCP